MYFDPNLTKEYIRKAISALNTMNATLTTILAGILPRDFAFNLASTI